MNRRPQLAGTQQQKRIPIIERQSRITAPCSPPPQMEGAESLRMGMVSTGALILAFLAYQLVGTNIFTTRAQQQAGERLTERIDEVRSVLADAGALPALAESESTIVAPTDVWVTDPRPGSWLTLTTCTPRFSARERLVVFAELVDGPNFHYVQQLPDSNTLIEAA